MVYGFLAIVLVMLPFMYFYWDLSPEATQLPNALMLLTIVVLSVLANYFMVYSLKRVDLSEIEPIRLMQPLLTILIAFFLSFFFVIYESEKNTSILILSLVASSALVLAHIKKSHLSFSKYDISAMLGSFLFALELALSKFILHYYNSVTFYFIRSLLVFLLILVVFHPRLDTLKTKTKFLIFLSGAIWVVYRIILYYGYSTLGIVFTTMLFILGPIFIYLFAWMFLKEKITWRQVVSSVVIIGCVVTALIING